MKNIILGYHIVRQIVPLILNNSLNKRCKLNEGAGQIDTYKMNWTTKAKTRAGRGKSKADIENQQRLTARNKLPKRESTSEAVRAHTADTVTLSTRYKPSHDYSSELSNDLMMLQSTSSCFASHKSRPSQPEQQYNRRTPKTADRDYTEDPLLLLEFTVIMLYQLTLIHLIKNHCF